MHKIIAVTGILSLVLLAGCRGESVSRAGNPDARGDASDDGTGTTTSTATSTSTGDAGPLDASRDVAITTSTAVDAARDLPDEAGPVLIPGTCATEGQGDALQPAPKGWVCRAKAGPCDVAETCSGDSLDCPDDAIAPARTVCNRSNDPCDVDDVCSGTSIDCPASPNMTAPGVTTATATVSSHSVNLKWKAVTDATGYGVLRSMNETDGYTSIATTTGTSYLNIAGITSGTQYYYQVVSLNGKCPSPGSNTMAVMPCSATTLTAIAYSTSVRLGWIATGQPNYSLYRSTTPAAADFSALATATGTAYTDNGVSGTTTYYYKINSNNPSCSFGESAAVNATPLGTDFLTATATSTAISVVASDNFDGKRLGSMPAGWSAYGNMPTGWAVAAGTPTQVLHYTRDTSSGYAYATLDATRAAINQSVEATFTVKAISSANSSYGGGVIARADDASNGYVLVLGTSSGKNLKLRRLKDGSDDGISGCSDLTLTTEAAVGTTVTLKLNVSGGATATLLQGYLNGNPVISCIDKSSPLLYGAAGVVSRTNSSISIDYDNVVVTTL